MGTIPRIMVVDDNAEEQALLEEAFASVGWTVALEWAFSVEPAARRLEELAARGHEPDLLILDIMMSGEPSLPLLARIRALPRLRQLPCVVMSGITPPYLLTQQYLQNGALRVLKKSNDFPGLVRFVATLRRFLVGHGSVSAGGSATTPRSSDPA
jgi:CheY-like chemotaxis protein